MQALGFIAVSIRLISPTFSTYLRLQNEKFYVFLQLNQPTKVIKIVSTLLKGKGQKQQLESKLNFFNQIAFFDVH